MLRETRAPREDWQRKVESLGLHFHSVDDQPYWNETAAYRLDPSEVDVLEQATNELQHLCLAAVETVIRKGELGRLGIPDATHSVIAKVWDDDPPAIYGRFDLA